MIWWIIAICFSLSIGFMAGTVWTDRHMQSK